MTNLLKLQAEAGIAGVDEAGRGPLAGPVAVAAVLLDPARIPKGLDDSKKLSAAKREALFDVILNDALSVAIVFSPPREIDRLNIRGATLEAMREAVEALAIQPAGVVIDGRDVPRGLSIPGRAIIGGDGTHAAIAAASILAKVARDRAMAALAKSFPGYGFERHKGYGSKVHLDALDRLGPCALHRMSFAPCAAAREAFMKR